MGNKASHFGMPIPPASADFNFTETLQKWDEAARKSYEEFVARMESPLGWRELYLAEFIAWLLIFQVFRIAGWMSPPLYRFYLAAHERFRDVRERYKFKRMTPEKQKEYLEKRKPLPAWSVAAVAALPLVLNLGRGNVIGRRRA